MKMRVVYAVPFSMSPSGGIRLIYRHAEELRREGVDAVVWSRFPVSYTWFEHDAALVAGETLVLESDDLLVLPEIYVRPDFEPAPGARKIILNQACFYTYRDWSEPDKYPGWQNPPHVWTVSEVGITLLGKLHPELNLYKIPMWIDTDVYAPKPPRTISVAWMPRKRTFESQIIRRMLTLRDPAGNWTIEEIGNVSERVVGEILGRTSVFVALGVLEGFGLPAAEALAAGCFVVGYPAGGGEEIFDGPGAWRVSEPDPTSVADVVMQVLERQAELEHLRTVVRHSVMTRWPREKMGSALVAAVAAALDELPGERCRAVHPDMYLFPRAVAAGRGERPSRSHRVVTKGSR